MRIGKVGKKAGLAEPESDEESDDFAEGELTERAEEIFKVQENDLNEYLTQMRLDELFTEMVEEVLVDAPSNPVKYMIDYLITRHPDQAHGSSYAKTFPEASNAIGAGVPLTGLVPAEAWVADASEDEDEDEDQGEGESEGDEGDDEESGSQPGSSQYEDASDSARSSENEARQHSYNRRSALCPEPCGDEVAASGNELSEEDKATLDEFLGHSPLLQGLLPHHRAAVRDKFTRLDLVYDETVFEEAAFGEAACTFYFVAQGQVEHHKGGKCTLVSNQGDSFGDMALLYDLPRRTTAKSSADGTALFALTRLDYKTALRESSLAHRAKMLGALSAVPLFAANLSEQEMLQLAEDVAEEETFAKGEVLIKQHAPSDKMFVIVSGAADCVQKVSPSAATVKVITFGAGDWFGEIALVAARPRAARVVAASDEVRCVTVGRDAFVRVLGPLTDVLRRTPAMFKRFVTDKI